MFEGNQWINWISATNLICTTTKYTTQLVINGKQWMNRRVERKKFWISSFRISIEKKICGVSIQRLINGACRARDANGELIALHTFTLLTDLKDENEMMQLRKQCGKIARFARFVDAISDSCARACVSYWVISRKWNRLRLAHICVERRNSWIWAK